MILFDRSVLRSPIICRKAADTTIPSQHVNLAASTDSQGYYVKISRYCGWGEVLIEDTEGQSTACCYSFVSVEKQAFK